MEIDITRLFNGEIETWDLSGSIATHGANAGPNTWAAARKAAQTEAPFLADAAALDAFRDHMRGYGAWSREKIAAWDAVHCNALFLQLVAGDMRESGLDEVEDMEDEAGWAAYEKGAEEGRFSGSIGRGWSAQLLCDTAAAYGWTNYLGSWFHPTLNQWSGAAPSAAVMACDVSGALDGLPHDAVYYSLGN